MTSVGSCPLLTPGRRPSVDALIRPSDPGMTISSPASMRLPDLDSLRCFEAAALALNFRRGARAVGLSPAAFSDRIRQLEDQVGKPLFRRNTRQVSLTVAGEELLPRASRVIAEAQRCLEGAGDAAAAFNWVAWRTHDCSAIVSGPHPAQD